VAVSEAMYKNLVAAALGINGLILVAIGSLIALSAQSQLANLGLDAEQVARVAPTFYGLGLADASSSFFSLFAMVLVYQQCPSGRTLGLVVAANQLVVGIGLFLLTGVGLALYFIAMRGAVIAALTWRLPSQQAPRLGSRSIEGPA